MPRIVDILSLLSNSVGFISLGIALVLAYFAVKSGKMQNANQAQGSAITAMRSEIETLRERMEDKDKENEKLNNKIIQLEQTIDTICTALKIRGMIITIQGEMINIQDRNGNSTTTKIKHA